MATRDDKVIDGSNLGYLWRKIKAAFWGKDETTEVSIDSTPTANSTNVVTSGGVKAALDNKQDTLVSGSNIKTVNGQSLVGSGDIQTTIRHTTGYWNNAQGFIPYAGQVIVYTDYQTVTETANGATNTINIPGIKIGDGLAYVQDLPFIDQDHRDQTLTHINNTDIHVTTLDKTFWNNKLNTDDNSEVLNGALIFNRN